MNTIATYDLATCLEAVCRGQIEDWVSRYLNGGPWANVGLRDGLLRQRRYWLGPLRVPLDRLERCCGPEPSMEFQVPVDQWERKVARIAAGLTHAEQLPPLIVEWRMGALSIRDGTHRYAAMVRANWQYAWIILWCNTLADYAAARTELVTTTTIPGAKHVASHLRHGGWVRYPGSVPDALLASARSAIELDLAQNFDPNRQVEYDHQSYCPDLRGTLPITNLLTHSPARHVLDELLGWENIGHDRGQIAIRRSHNAERAYAPTWHIDGVPTGENGVIGPYISNFTVLLGVYLTPIDGTFSGNFVVWPGSHKRIEAHFRSRGPIAMQEGKPKVDVGEPLQLPALPGDMILCHYQLAHAAAANVSSRDRVAVYFRVWLRDIDERRWQVLTSMWEGWRV
jgi:hypothetical protein